MVLFASFRYRILHVNHLMQDEDLALQLAEISFLVYAHQGRLTVHVQGGVRMGHETDSVAQLFGLFS